MLDNEFNLEGFAGDAPKFFKTKAGKEAASISLAQNRTVIQKDGTEIDKPEWYQVAIFNDFYLKVAKEHVRKGTHLRLRTQVKPSEWEDEEGKKHYSYDIVINNSPACYIRCSNKDSNESVAANDSKASKKSAKK